MPFVYLETEAHKNPTIALWTQCSKFGQLDTLTMAYLICSLFSKQPPCIDTDEASLGNVIKTANSPASILSLEHLKFKLQRLLSHSIQTCARTPAPVPTQVDTI